MTRDDKLLQMCSLEGLGLEIGPSYAPLVPKSKGYNVEILDYTDKNGLIEKFKGHNVNINNIEEVDYIYRGGSYVDTIKKTERYDYIIASNVIEHTICIISFLQDCMALLKPGGVLSLAIPDKRFCFDYFRPLSTLAEAVNCFLSSDKQRHNLGMACEHYINQVSIDGAAAWDRSGRLSSEMELVHNPESIKGIIDIYKDSEEYVDVHHWVFTKASFDLLFHDLTCLGFIKDMRIVKSFDTEGYEFIVIIGKSDGETSPEEYSTGKRMTLLREVEKELAWHKR